MKAKEFINILTSTLSEKKLKIVDENGCWVDVGLDEDIPQPIYGYAIYIKAKMPTSFIAMLEPELTG